MTNNNTEGEQLVLAEGMRLERPDCYDHVIDLMLSAIEFNSAMSAWPPAYLAQDMIDYANVEYEKDEIERSIRVWRELNNQH